MRKLLGFAIPTWLLLVGLVAALSIVGTVYALITVLNQYNVGYIQLGECKSFAILSTNGTITPGNLNLNTVTMNPTAITSTLSWKDDSAISRTTPLVPNGITSFNFPILGPLNLTTCGSSQGDFNITITMQPSNSTFLNYTDVI